MAKSNKRSKSTNSQNTKKKPQDTQLDTTNAPEEPSKEYVERAEELTKPIADILDKEGIDTACIVLIDPKLNDAITYVRGEVYARTKLLVQLTRYHKQLLNKELQI